MKEYAAPFGPDIGTKTYAFVTRDRKHLKANATLSGMLFGHLVNESSYPDVNESQTYHHIYIVRGLLGESAEAFDAADGIGTQKGSRIGYGAMSAYFLNQLSSESQGSIQGWSEDLIENEQFRSDFVYGFGISLHAAWDYYTDTLIAQGRQDEYSIDFDADNTDLSA